MAGAIARYGRPRCRVRLTVVGIEPLTAMLGGILEAVEDPDGGAGPVAAPITDVRFTCYPKPATVLRAGYAR